MTNFSFILISAFILGCALSFCLGGMVGQNFETTRIHREAFEQGLMVKEIDHETDKVIYRWIETHKLGYED